MERRPWVRRVATALAEFPDVYRGQALQGVGFVFNIDGA